MIKKIILTALYFLSTLILFAQEKTDKADMADLMHSNGKIYVVIAVILTIFAGLIIYLIRLDRKLSKLEKNHHS